MRYYLAIDIGASSGRHIIGWKENGEIKTEEVYRFYNGVVERDGHLTWDVERLFQEVKAGIRRSFEKYEIESLSIDTWGVDYVLLEKNQEIYPVYAYRDNRTADAIPKVHEICNFSKLYSYTGCQFQPFTTIYQLYDDLSNGRLTRATDILMMPEYLLFKLSGVKAREYTEWTTSGLVNAKTGEIDWDLIETLGYPARLFGELQQPGTVLGNLLPEVAAEVGGNCQVVLCATHDTGSAVEGIPMEEDAPYISSGTWSLLGVKTDRPITNADSEQANYSNEGGVGYNRYQKNIMGMWLVNELQKELCPDMPYPQIVKAAEDSTYHETVDANAQIFFAPKSMKAAFDSAAKTPLKTTGDYFRCAYRSLAESYRKALEELEQNTGKTFEKLYIMGGGAKNGFFESIDPKYYG